MFAFRLWETLPSNMLAGWAVFMMPLLITWETAPLNGIEHGDGQWKHICAPPVPRPAIYLAKGERFTTALVLGGGGAVAALPGCLEFVRRDVA